MSSVVDVASSSRRLVKVYHLSMSTRASEVERITKRKKRKREEKEKTSRFNCGKEDGYVDLAQVVNRVVSSSYTQDDGNVNYELVLTLPLAFLLVKSMFAIYVHAYAGLEYNYHYS